MTIGKIEIDLEYLKYNLNAKELEIVANYLNGNKAIETIRKLIEVISQNELTLYTEEDFSTYYLYEKCEYNLISKEQTQEFIKHKVIDPSKEVLPSYYSNFLYLDGKCIDPATQENMSKVEFIPCLVELSHHCMITYYIFEWTHYNNHNFEIED